MQSLLNNSRVQSFDETFYRAVDTTLPSEHRLMFILSILSTGKDSRVTYHLSSLRPALLTLQRHDLSHQHLWVHLLGEHPHSHVYQLGAEDGQQLLPHSLTLAPFAGTAGLSPPGRAPLGSLRRWRVRMDRVGVWRGRKRSGPVSLLLLLLVVALLELWWLAVCVPADGVRAVSRELRRLPLLVVVVGRLGGVRAAAAWCSWRRAVLVSVAVQVLQAPVGASVLVVAPAVYGAQTRIQLLLRLSMQRAGTLVR